jgi:hypothetical protein
MKENGFTPSSALQKATFEAIKAKLQNIHTYYSSKGDPLLLELADMSCLLSAQFAFLGEISTRSFGGKAR